MNTFGRNFRFTSFGESHGAVLGGIIDGCPAGLTVDFDFVQRELARRRPAQSAITTQRAEKDKVTFLSGIFEGKTTGAPIGFIIENNDAQSADYEEIKNIFRPSHADFTWYKKYGMRDFRGGGRSSARETAARVTAGALAKIILAEKGIAINAFTSQIGTYKISIPIETIDFAETETNDVRCPQPDVAAKMIDYIKQLKEEGDSIGGVVTCAVSGLCAGTGEPVFGKLQARLAAAMMSIPAAHGFDYGIGFEGVTLKGSQQNDEFVLKNGKTVTATNNSGGIQGGISNGMSVYFRVLFKPASSIACPQQTVDIHGQAQTINIAGRHDPCVVPRAVPVVEAMAAMTLADMILGGRK
ncbi:MAG: chorismate synthase [Prevotellaceae bacterium]|jgi:chorismate synthase|nr:chorismate synthase [Prevotellaceae bacterium]